MRLSRGLFAIALLAAAGLPTAVAADPNEGDTNSAEPPSPTRWLPLEAGQRWTYQFTRERTRRDGAEEKIVERLRGTRVDEVVPLANSIPGADLAIESVLRGRGDGAAADTIESSRVLLDAASPNGRVVGLEATDPYTGDAELARFSPGLETLPSRPTRGQRWHVGIERKAGIETSTEGEILGVQDVETPAGAFPRCLVVRTRGTHKGSLDLNGAHIELRGGETVTTSWYAAGIGRVLVKQETTKRVAMPDGSDIEFEESVEFALRESASAGSQDAADQIALSQPEPESELPEAPAPLPLEAEPVPGAPAP